MAHPTLHQQVFEGALDRLENEVRRIQKSEAAFWSGYQQARRCAFEVEFLGKFYHKSGTANKRDFSRLIRINKDLEDCLGRIDEIDAMVPWCKDLKITLPDGAPAWRHFERIRESEYKKLKSWLKKNGWQSGAALRSLRDLTDKIRWFERDENLKFARERMDKSLKDLQNDITSGLFDPKSGHGYKMVEVESRVHKLRREIRKQAQYLTYTGGLFAFDPKAKGHSRRQLQTLDFYAPLTKTSFAKDRFSKLPTVRLSEPLLLPRPFFLAINRYVSELGQAKDWALNLYRLKQAGLKGAIDFDQLDVKLRNWRGVPMPFDKIVTTTLDELKSKRLFAVMAEMITPAG